ncbi:hypothetical protein FEM48_Zijuj06G0165900 [Ziziphus jujuba var. spinosa]|uniref:Non-haem dioxygenase N-terminal domain-containing protein n=1 Tax=Ziziphus jujuba var. spinosa TaxID=714518 RepID=A0A978VAE3_ZIZJJ|nr:hypothetical protein FEM48_Zijuj06G0165900 [Ziziphus jujuba var. spinosa]
MAPVVFPTQKTEDIQQNKMASIKELAESGGLTSVPSEYTFASNPNDQADQHDPDHSMPTIDFSLLMSTSPDQRAKILHDLRKACEEWGFFMLINHGVPESLMKNMIDVCQGFFNLPEEEKKVYQSRNLLDPIKYGTSFNAEIDKVLLWRDFLKVISHPRFHSLPKPEGYRAVVNNRAPRISIAVPHGPSLETVVVAAPELVEKQGRPPAYKGLSYHDFLEYQQSAKCYMKSCLDAIRL